MSVINLTWTFIRPTFVKIGPFILQTGTAKNEKREFHTNKIHGCFLRPRNWIAIFTQIQQKNENEEFYTNKFWSKGILLFHFFVVI